MSNAWAINSYLCYLLCISLFSSIVSVESALAVQLKHLFSEFVYSHVFSEVAVHCAFDHCSIVHFFTGYCASKPFRQTLQGVSIVIKGHFTPESKFHILHQAWCMSMSNCFGMNCSVLIDGFWCFKNKILFSSNVSSWKSWPRQYNPEVLMWAVSIHFLYHSTEESMLSIHGWKAN